MATMQEIQKRIDGIRVTRQIAQAMRLVSNTKIRRCRELTESSRPFFEESRYLLETFIQASGGQGRIFENRPGPALFIVVGGDRGLCGGYNMNVCREAQSLMTRESRFYRRAVREADDQPQDAVIFTLGNKVKDFFTRRGVKIEKSYQGISQSPFYSDGMEIAGQALALYQENVVQKIVLVYTVYESMLTHTPTAIQLLPLTPTTANRPVVCFEPEEEQMLSAILPDYFAGCIFGALSEGALCEQSARITSMDSAVKNCDDLIETMQTRYNQARQDSITQELNEIVGGARALKVSD